MPQNTAESTGFVFRHCVNDYIPTHTDSLINYWGQDGHKWTASKSAGLGRSGVSRLSTKDLSRLGCHDALSLLTTPGRRPALLLSGHWRPRSGLEILAGQKQVRDLRFGKDVRPNRLMVCRKLRNIGNEAGRFCPTTIETEIAGHAHPIPAYRRRQMLVRQTPGGETLDCEFGGCGRQVGIEMGQSRSLRSVPPPAPLLCGPPSSPGDIAQDNRRSANASGFVRRYFPGTAIRASVSKRALDTRGHNRHAYRSTEIKDTTFRGCPSSRTPPRRDRQSQRRTRPTRLH